MHYESDYVDISNVFFKNMVVVAATAAAVVFVNCCASVSIVAFSQAAFNSKRSFDGMLNDQFVYLESSIFYPNTSIRDSSPES